MSLSAAARWGVPVAVSTRRARSPSARERGRSLGSAASRPIPMTAGTLLPTRERNASATRVAVSTVLPGSTAYVRSPRYAVAARGWTAER